MCRCRRSTVRAQTRARSPSQFALAGPSTADGRSTKATKPCGLIAATLAVVLIGKPVIALLTVRVLGYCFKTALTIAIALGQIGEFSFILSSIGRDLGILPVAATNTLGAAAIVSSF